MRRRQGSILGATAALLVGGMVGAGLAAGWSEEGVRIVVRFTAKLAVVAFCLAFGASSLRRLVDSGPTRWLLVNRRALGLSFAASHTFHLFALIALGLAFPDPFVSQLDAVTLVGGGLAYVFLFAMAATSTDAAVLRLGQRNWSRLHTAGGWYIWLIFAQSYLPRAATDPAYLPFAALLVAVVGLRLQSLARRGGARLRASTP